jgi:glycerol-3-phosphate acyltransferase PlsY
MADLPEILMILGAYLLGAVPFGLLFGRVMGGVDVRSLGSGNIGATNVLRAAGKKAAVLTLLADAAKGVVPVLAASRLSPDTFLPAAAGFAAIVGHNFPIYLRFRGGKGVATSFGVALATSPLIGAICLAVWLASALAWRFSSLAALVAFAAYPVIIFAARSGDRPQAMLSLFIFALIYVRHRENIKRLLAGTEPKIGQKR